MYFFQVIQNSHSASRYLKMIININNILIQSWLVIRYELSGVGTGFGGDRSPQGNSSDIEAGCNRPTVPLDPPLNYVGF